MGETTNRGEEFVLPKRVWLLFLLTPLVGPLVGYSAAYWLFRNGTLRGADITFILLARAIGAVAQITCVVLWRRLGVGDR